jgi:hypothetical protein
MTSTKTLVRTNVTLTEEDYCLYNMNNEHIKAVTNCDSSVQSTNNNLVQSLLVDIKFDKCDCTKATLVICVPVPDNKNEAKVYVKAGERVVTTLCVNKIEDFANGNVTKSTTVELFNCSLLSNNNSFPSCLQVILPLTEDLKCLAPDYGTNNPLSVQTLYDKRVDVNVKSKDNEFKGYLTYDMHNCEVCLNVDIGVSNDSSDIFKTYNVYGLNKCTETVLFSFQLCLDVVSCESNDVPLISVRSNNCDYCYRLLQK